MPKTMTPKTAVSPDINASQLGWPAKMTKIIFIVPLKLCCLYSLSLKNTFTNNILRILAAAVVRHSCNLATGEEDAGSQWLHHIANLRTHLIHQKKTNHKDRWEYIADSCLNLQSHQETEAQGGFCFLRLLEVLVQWATNHCEIFRLNIPENMLCFNTLQC